MQARLAGLIDRVMEEKLIEVLTGCEIKAVEGLCGQLQNRPWRGRRGKDPGARRGHPGHRRHGIPARRLPLRQRPQGFSPAFPSSATCWRATSPAQDLWFSCSAWAPAYQSAPGVPRSACTQSVMKAIELKEKDPSRPVMVLYRQMRTYGLREALYRKARGAWRGFHPLRARQAL